MTAEATIGATATGATRGVAPADDDDGPPRLVGAFGAGDHWASASPGGDSGAAPGPLVPSGRDASSGELLVRVRHGSLEHAPYRVVAGHFQGLPLSGAEARLNERTDGRLERLLLRNLYPQGLGEMVLLEPVDDAPPRGVVIVGLGPNGELSALQL